MIWVNRAGIKSMFLDYYLQNAKIYLPWEGFKTNLSELNDISQFKEIVINEKGDQHRTSISNWAGQLYSFSKVIEVGDYVLIPHTSSRAYIFAEVSGGYEYDPDNPMKLWHSHNINILKTSVPRNAFSQAMQYSLGTFRTLFKIKNEEECLASITKIQ